MGKTIASCQALHQVGGPAAAHNPPRISTAPENLALIMSSLQAGHLSCTVRGSRSMTRAPWLTASPETAVAGPSLSSGQTASPRRWRARSARWRALVASISDTRVRFSTVPARRTPHAARRSLSASVGPTLMARRHPRECLGFGSEAKTTNRLRCPRASALRLIRPSGTSWRPSRAARHPPETHFREAASPKTFDAPSSNRLPGETPTFRCQRRRPTSAPHAREPSQSYQVRGERCPRARRAHMDRRIGGSGTAL